MLKSVNFAPYFLLVKMFAEIDESSVSNNKLVNESAASRFSAKSRNT